ncbi:hypothetical protein AZE42_06716 [Rhizopogon vesiculosus]|uniref:Uncharacterized protein n=1 Tax=Rhizopogon vesiculosus TaxID=180088 RepID=A0A1J8R1C2_9AGAM|nr:hypothetical protein AZE42_06716 [Rhizopogon vesiculosus]
MFATPVATSQAWSSPQLPRPPPVTTHRPSLDTAMAHTSHCRAVLSDDPLSTRLPSGR